ncbi:MAG: PQQ-binding-like beta-propeller repeat protein [Bacteroidota bacterium]|nr:PQQ-binding-like beta-propeller repeat protein [Bacteroidota bacterium]
MKQIIITTIFSICVLNTYGQDSLKWTFQAKSGIYTSAAADRNNIYFGSNDSNFYVLDKTNGNLKWKYKTNGQIKSQPALFDESVIINSSDGNLYSFDKNTGKILWIFKTKGEKRYDMWDYYLSSPITYQSTVYVGSGDGFVYAVGAKTGKLDWSFNTGDIVHATPVIEREKVFIGSYNGTFYSLDCKSGDLVWQFKTVGDRYFPKGEIQKGAAVYKNSIIFGSRDYNIYSLDLSTGRGLWNMKEKYGSWIIAIPFVYKDKIYFGTSDSHQFYSMNADGGNIEWALPINMRVYGSAASYNDRIYFGCFNGKLYGVNPRTGKIEYTFQTYSSREKYPSIYRENGEFREDFQLYGSDMQGSEKKILDLGSILATPLIDEGVIYFGDSKGTFYALKLK